MLTNQRIKAGILFLIACSGIVWVFFIAPIQQDPKYHLFADRRTYSEIPHFWNVITNIPFMIIGLSGIFILIRNKTLKENEWSYNKLIFFLGIFFTGIGSAIYHLSPSNDSLLWDRLPMTITFMSFFSIVIGEYICSRSAKHMLFPLLILGFLSLVFWKMTENRGCGDLRFYVLIQFLPLVLIPLIILLFKNNSKNTQTYMGIIVCYAMAKLFEVYDEFFFVNIFISGHSLKHLAAALAPFLLLWTEIKKAAGLVCLEN